MAGFDFAFHVKLRSGIISDEDGGKSGADVLLQVEVNGLPAQFGKDFVADFQAIEDARGHAQIIAWGENDGRPGIRGRRERRRVTQGFAQSARRYSGSTAAHER